MDDTVKLSFDVSDTEDKVFSSQGDGKIVYRERPFESDCFGNRTAEILEWSGNGFADGFSLLLEEEGFVSGDLLYLRLEADDISSIQQAEGAGFYFIESSIIPYIRLRNWDRGKYSKFIQPMVAVDDSMIVEVESIARETFRGLRFNLDPHIGDEQADRRYFTWLRNAYENDEDIRAIKHHDRIAGFSLLRRENDKVVYRLAGMRTDLKNAGLGMMLYASTMAYCQDIGIKHIDGGISMANCPVLNVMASLGFVFKDPTIVLHYYVS